MTDPLIGVVINGKFQVVAPLGMGGMGAVYRAEQLPLGRIVAVKVLRNKPGVLQVDPAFQRRFFLEASLCAKLSHPNIVTIYDYGRIESVEDEAYFMAMELLDGETLHTRLRRSGGALPLSETLTLVLEIARGLREAHRNGIVHRDLKPGNIMLVPDAESGEKVKILDFGLVKQVDGDNREDLTQEGSFLGSPKYMSPEQIDKVDVDHRTDLYALGVIMFQCLCGRVPFDGQSSMQILLAHVASPIPPMRERNPAIEVPTALEAIARKLLSKNPADRYASADELIRELRSVQPQLGLPARATQSTNDLPISEALPPDPSGSLVAASVTDRRPSTLTAQPTPRSRAVAAALVAVGVLALGSAAAVMMRHARDTHPAASERVIAPTTQAALTPATPVVTAPTLRIESTPSGAVVMEDGHNLGVTPVAIAIDANRVDVRHFTLALAGYQAYHLDQPPTHDSARVAAMLSPDAPAPATPTNAVATNTQAADPGETRRGHRGHGSHGTQTAPRAAVTTGTTTPAGHPLDIMTER